MARAHKKLPAYFGWGKKKSVNNLVWLALNKTYFYYTPSVKICFIMPWTFSHEGTLQFVTLWSFWGSTCHYNFFPIWLYWDSLLKSMWFDRISWGHCCYEWSTKPIMNVWKLWDVFLPLGNALNCVYKPACLSVPALNSFLTRSPLLFHNRFEYKFFSFSPVPPFLSFQLFLYSSS